MRQMNLKGLTLVEVLVVAAIIGVVSTSIYTVCKSGLDSWSEAQKRLEIYQNARVAIEQMSRELASAIAFSGQNSFWGQNSNPDILNFISEIEGKLFEIGYSRSGENLIRSYDKSLDYNFSDNDGSGILAYHIKDLQFKYWKKGETTNWGIALDEWSDLTGEPPRDILPEAVKITLTVQMIQSPPAPPAVESKKFEFETVIYLPNSESQS